MSTSPEPITADRDSFSSQWSTCAFAREYGQFDSCEGIIKNSFDFHVSFACETVPTGWYPIDPSIREFLTPDNTHVTKYTRLGFFISSDPTIHGVVELYGGSRGTSLYGSVLQEILKRIEKTKDLRQIQRIIVHERKTVESSNEETEAIYKDCEIKHGIKILRILWRAMDSNPATHLFHDMQFEDKSVEEILLQVLKKSANGRMSPRTAEEIWGQIVSRSCHQLWSEYFYRKNCAKKEFFGLPYDFSPIVYDDEM